MLGGLLGGRTKTEPAKPWAGADVPRRIVPPVPIKVPALTDDAEYRQALENSQRISARLSELTAKRDSLAAGSLTGASVTALATGDSNKLMKALADDNTGAEEVARLEREIGNLHRAHRAAAEHLAIVKRGAGWRVGAQYRAALAALRADAVAKLTTAYDALQGLLAAGSAAEDAELSGCGPGCSSGAAARLFNIIAGLKEFMGGSAVQTPGAGA